jgi:hypothetical protein
VETVWLPAKDGRLEEATYDQYRWAVTRHIVQLIGAVRPGPARLHQTLLEPRASGT